MLLLLLFGGALTLPWVQTNLAKAVVPKLLEKENVAFDIQRLEIVPFSSIRIRGLYLSDQKKDTLAYLHQLKLSVSDWNVAPFRLEVKKAKLDSVKFYLNIPKNETETNLQFLLDRFSTSEDSTQSDYTVKISQLDLQAIYFDWKDFNKPDTLKGVNFDRLELKNFGGVISNATVAPNAINASIKGLHLSEHSGFEINELNTQLDINQNVIDLDSLVLATPETFIRGRYAMRHDAYQNFTDYIHKVHMEALLDSSTISTNDLAYFVSSLIGYNQSVGITGDFSGTVSSFEMNRFLITYRKNTYLEGKMDIHGLPEVKGTQFNVYLDRSQIQKSTLEQIPIGEGQYLRLPAQLKKLSYASIQGKYIGTLKNFIADATFETNLGQVSTDIQVSSRGSKTSYQGDVGMRRLDLGRILGNDQFNKVTGKLKMKGSGVELKTADVLASGQMTRFDFSGYRYRDIRLDGRIKDHIFEGKLDVNDPYCQLGFDGALNFLPHQDTYRFNLKVDTLYPVLLGLYERDSSAFFRGDVTIDVVGSTLDTAEGFAYLTDVFYQEKDSSFALDSFKVESFVKDSLRQIHMRSSLGLISLKGDAVLKGVDDAVAKILDNAVPAYFENDYNINQNKGGLVLYANFNERLNDVVSVFLPALNIDSSLEVRSALFLDPPLLSFAVNSKGIEYGDFNADSLELTGGFKDSLFQFEFIADTLSFQKNFRAENLILSATFSEDSVNLFLDYLNSTKRNYSGEINVAGKIKGTNHLGFSLYDSYVEVADSVWYFEPNNYVEVDSNRTWIKDLQVNSFDKLIRITGTIGGEYSDTVRLKFNNLNLGNMGRMMNRSDLQLKGSTSGELMAISALSNPTLLSDVAIKGLEFNTMPIGSGDLISSWNSELERAEVDFDLIRLPDSIIPDTIHSLKVSGYLYPKNEEQQLDLTLGTQGFYLKSLEPFTKSFMDSLDGRISGYIDVLGAFSEPVLSGNFDIVDSRFRVKYLNTTYYAKNEKLRIESDWFGFDNLKLIDQNGNKANTIATVYHDNFTNFNYDVSIDMKDFLVLNTTKYDNDLYYGKGFLTGYTNLSGYDQTLFLELNAKTAKQSEFVIPLTGAAEIGQSDFITFVNSDGSIEEEDKKGVDLSGIEMTFNLKVDPTAKVRMIFDETTGDELSARGAGNIKLEINSEGDFGMYGKYRVTSGDYGFTYKKAFSKKFTLEEGGTIAWTGDPLNADLDITAIYNVRAPLGDILNDSTMTTKVNNECLMKMTDKLSNPSIDFGIRLPNASPGIANQVKSQMSSQEEVNKQVFSLLLFNRYAPPQSGFNAGGIGQATSSDLISNQLNNWISKMDNNLFDLGISEVKSDELEFAVSKKFLDDRLILESNVGVNRNAENGAEAEGGQVVGDFKIEYLFTENGKVRGKVFNRTENRSSIEMQNGANAQTQGIGIVLREDFNSLGELWKNMFGSSKKNKNRKRDKKQKANDKGKLEESD